MPDAIRLGSVYADTELRLQGLRTGIEQAKRDYDKFGSDLKAKSERLGRDLQGFGQRWMAGISAPILALGTAALTTATRMDSLKRGLTAVAGSSAEAERQMKRLKEVAKLPGLGMEEAIQGSIRLQAAGLSAKTAERSLRAFGNAIATVGGGKAELEGVAYALGQIATEGKVFKEEINQLTQRVPQIRKAMEEAFGTSNTEKLQKMGLTAKEFIEGVTSVLERQKQVTGGAQNAFENLQDSAKRALDSIGKELLPRAAAAADKAATALEKFADAFQRLPGETKDSIVNIAGIAVAIGGVTFALGKVMGPLGTFVGFLSRIKALGPFAAVGGLATALGTWQAGISNAIAGGERANAPLVRGTVATAQTDPAFRAARMKFLTTQIAGIRGSMDFMRGNYPQERVTQIEADLKAYEQEMAQLRTQTGQGVGSAFGFNFGEFRIRPKSGGIAGGGRRWDPNKYGKKKAGKTSTWEAATGGVPFWMQGLESAASVFGLDAAAQDAKASGLRMLDAIQGAFDGITYAVGALLSDIVRGNIGGIGQSFSGKMVQSTVPVPALFGMARSLQSVLPGVPNAGALTSNAGYMNAQAMLEAANAQAGQIAESLGRQQKRFTRGFDWMRDFAANLGEEFYYSFSDGLARMFGRNPFGRALSRTLSRWLDTILTDALNAAFKKGDKGGGKGKTDIGSIFGGIAMGVGANLLGGWLGHVFGGLFAEGGTAPGRKWSIVGERGPELIYPASSTRVVPMAAGAGGITVNMHGTTIASSLDARDVGRQIARGIDYEMRLHGRVPV